MRKALLLLLLMPLIFSGCNNELDTTAEPKEIIIIYGVLNPQADQQIVRVAKAFLIDGNFVEYAGNNDLSVANASVRITNNEGDVIDLSATDTLKDDGVFNRPHSVYVTADSIKPGIPYRLTVTLENGQVYTASTLVPAAPRVASPAGIIVLPGMDTAYAIAPFNDPDMRVSFAPKGLFIGNQQPGVAFELRIYFDWQLDGVPQPTLRYGPGAPTTILGGFTSGFINVGQGFQSFLQARINGGNGGDATYDDSNRSEACRIEITAMDQQLHNFLQVNSPAFIDFNSTRPQYTNLEGEDVYGLFGSINTGSSFVRLPQCTEYLAGLNDVPPPSTDCPEKP